MGNASCSPSRQKQPGQYAGSASRYQIWHMLVDLPAGLDEGMAQNNLRPRYFDIF